MKKILITMLTSLFLVAGCQSNDTKANERKQPAVEQEKELETKSTHTFPYPHLLAQDKQSYALLVIGANNEETPIEQNRNISEHVKNILSLPTAEMAQKAYPKLEIKSKISYILFDKMEMVYESKTIEGLTSFLQKNPPSE